MIKKAAQCCVAKSIECTIKRDTRKGPVAFLLKYVTNPNETERKRKNNVVFSKTTGGKGRETLLRSIRLTT